MVDVVSSTTEEETLLVSPTDVDADLVVGVSLLDTWDVCAAIGADSVPETDKLSEAAAELALVKVVSLADEIDS